MTPGQSRVHSALEAALNILVGYGVAVGAQIAIFPLFGIRVGLADNLAIGAAFTVRPWCAPTPSGGRSTGGTSGRALRGPGMQKGPARHQGKPPGPDGALRAPVAALAAACRYAPMATMTRRRVVDAAAV